MDSQSMTIRTSSETASISSANDREDQSDGPDSAGVISSSITIHAIGLPAIQAGLVDDAAGIAGFALRQYPTLEKFTHGTAPSAAGCVLISGGTEPARDETIIRQLQSHFFSMPILVLLETDSASSAVAMMQLGAFSVLPRPVEHEQLIESISSAVELSSKTLSTVDDGRICSKRMLAATEKEREVLDLIMKGRKNKEIAAELGITIRAVEDRRFRLMKKVGVDSVAELVALAVRARDFNHGVRSAPTRAPISSGSHHCVKGIEIWSPSPDGSHLALQQASYRDAYALQDASQGMTFEKGEGLPGRIWDQRSPAFLKELITTAFVRSDVADAAGVTTAVGLPIFCEGRIQSIVLLLLDSRHQMKAAFESWQFDSNAGGLRLAAGTYINCERLRRSSEFLVLPYGEGLAGVAAEDSRPYVGARFSDDANVVRGIALAGEQLISGVAVPLTDSGAPTSDIFILLNSQTTQMFSLLQLWKPSPDGRDLKLAAEFVDGVASLSSQTSAVTSRPDRGIAGDAWMKRSPVVAGNGSVSSSIVRCHEAHTLSIGLAIPTIVNGQVTAVTVMAN